MSEEMNLDYNELKKTKIKIRTQDLLKSECIEMVLLQAERKAKNENRKVIDNDIINAIKKNIKETESTIALIDSKNEDASKWKAELSIYNSMLPSSSKNSTDILSQIEAVKNLWKSEEKDWKKKSMGAIMKTIRTTYPNVDMSQVSRKLQEVLD